MNNSLLPAKYLYALELVARLFEDKKRDMTGAPYVTHLFGVCSIVQQLSGDQIVWIAALLHDVLEDIPADKYSAEQLETDFGSEVLRLVRTVSHDEMRYGKDEARKQYLRQLQAASSIASLVSGADMLHNGRDIIFWYARDPEKAGEIFGGERAKRRSWFWRERLGVIEAKLGVDHLLVKELREMLHKLDPINQKIM